MEGENLFLRFPFLFKEFKGAEGVKGGDLGIDNFIWSVVSGGCMWGRGDESGVGLVRLDQVELEEKVTDVMEEAVVLVVAMVVEE
eukprot:15346101-Ditylum_brightwellii.AAC.1